VQSTPAGSINPRWYIPDQPRMGRRQNSPWLRRGWWRGNGIVGGGSSPRGIPPAAPGAKLCNPLAGVKRSIHEIQCGHAGPPLRQHGIVGHRPTYGTMLSAGNMIGFDRPQRGHNILAHGSAVGVLGGWDCGRVFGPRCNHQCHLDRALRREI
jgi:hypothetical protein